MNQLVSSPQSGSMFSRTLEWINESLFQEKNALGFFEPLIQMALPGWTTDTVRSKVVGVRYESDEVYSLEIRPGFGWKIFQPGQHIQITAEQEGVLQTRTFSISSSPEYYKKTGLIELTIREQQAGKVTPWLKNHFAQKGYCNLSQAMGTFVLPNNQTPLVMIAGGSGITPFRSMLGHLAKQNSQRDVQLLFYIRNEDNSLFKQEFENIAAQFKNIKVTLINSEKEGFISSEHLQEHCPDLLARTLMVCGPTPMIQATRRLAAEMGLTEDKIRFEYFGAAPIEMNVDETEVFVNFTHSRVSTVSNTKEPLTLLDLAESEGLKPLSGCRVGVCMQCVCTKKSGVVFNTLTGQHSDTGIQDIQACISVPVSDVELDI